MTGDAPDAVTQHRPAVASRRTGPESWDVYCDVCRLPLVEGPSKTDAGRRVVLHDGRPDLDADEELQLDVALLPPGIRYCCVTLGWVTPEVYFDHHYHFPPDDIQLEKWS